MKVYSNIEKSVKAFNQRMVELEHKGATSTKEYKQLKAFTKGIETAKGRLSLVKVKSANINLSTIDRVGVQPTSRSRANEKAKERNNALRNARKRKETFERRGYQVLSQYQTDLQILRRATTDINYSIDVINDLFRRKYSKEENLKGDVEKLIQENKDTLYVLEKQGLLTVEEEQFLDDMRNGKLRKQDYEELMRKLKKIQKSFDNTTIGKENIEEGRTITKIKYGDL